MILTIFLTALTLIRVFFGIAVDVPYAANCDLNAACNVNDHPICYFPCVLSEKANWNVTELLRFDPVIRQGTLSSRLTHGKFGFLYSPLLVLVTLAFWAHKKWARTAGLMLACAMSASLIQVLGQYIGLASNPAQLFVYKAVDILIPLVLFVKGLVKTRKAKEGMEIKLKKKV
eukprot:TRINITY_DN8493_c0_g1_i1.p1 TRINITY_DN8493_c0_g1~~TRINITY_DN8493_c0_g1_i1.p1  ORF type:complete len:173 (+),score=18.40 TRINITY_DN8493_c0_g1_i1:102-620(+)